MDRLEDTASGAAAEILGQRKAGLRAPPPTPTALKVPLFHLSHLSTNHLPCFSSLFSLGTPVFLPRLSHPDRQDAQTSNDFERGELRASGWSRRAVGAPGSNEEFSVRVAFHVRAGSPRSAFVVVISAHGCGLGYSRPRLTRRSLPSLSHPFHSRGASSPTTPNGRLSWTQPTWPRHTRHIHSRPTTRYREDYRPPCD